MGDKSTVNNSAYAMKNGIRHYSLPRWIAGAFINLILSAVIFFLAGILAISLYFPKVYKSEAEIYVAAESGNTKVSASALAQVLADSASFEILDAEDGSGLIPDSMRIMITTDLGEGIVRVLVNSEDPYNAFDSVSRAVKISRKYMQDNNAVKSMRIVKNPEIAEHYSYMFMLQPALICALAGFIFALILTIVSHGLYKHEYYEEKRKKELEAASAYAVFSSEDGKAYSDTERSSASDELIRSLSRYAAETEKKDAGVDIRKIMSAKDPADESGRIVIPSYAEDEDDEYDEDAVNFLVLNRKDAFDVSSSEDFDDEAQEEDLAKLFGDAPSSLNESSDSAKGGE